MLGNMVSQREKEREREHKRAREREREHKRARERESIGSN